jgi:cell wall-associated NlpC family hydrolase
LKKILITLTFILTTNLYAQDSLIKPFIKEWLGKPYKFGGESKKGIDCSAFVQRFYKEIYHVLIPRTCEYIYTFNLLKKVELNDIIVGDILLFRSKVSPSGWHTGIYVGNDEFIHAANYKDGVKISCIHDSYYEKNLKGVRRLKIN